MNDSANEIIEKWMMLPMLIAGQTTARPQQVNILTKVKNSRKHTNEQWWIRHWSHRSIKIYEYFSGITWFTFNCEIELSLAWPKECVISGILNNSEVPAYAAVDPPTAHPP